MGWKSCVSILAPTVQLYRNWLGTLRWGRSGLSSAPEASGTALARGKFLDHVQLHLHHRHDQELRDAVHRVDRERLFRPVPDRYHDLTLVVGVDQAHQIPKNDAVLVPEPGARQNDRGKFRIGEVDGDTAGNQFRRSRSERERLVDTGAEIETRRTGGGGLRQAIAQPRGEDPDVEGLPKSRLAPLQDLRDVRDPLAR